MAPIGSRHAGIVDHLTRLLTFAVGEKAIVRVQNPIILGQYSEPEPDIALLKPRADFYKPAHPMAADVLLLIEVADTTEPYDREVKLPLYARCGIPEVWIVDVERHVLRVFREPTGDSYRQAESVASRGTIAPRMLSDCRIELEGLL